MGAAAFRPLKRQNAFFYPVPLSVFHSEARDSTRKKAEEPFSGASG